MKSVLPLLMLILSSQLFAQSIIIEELNTMSGDISGTEFDYNTSVSLGAYGDAEFKITNVSDSTFLMGFHVELLTSGDNWGSHALVWAHEDNQFGGIGFAGSYIDNGFSFPTTEYVQLLPGESAFLNPSWYVEGEGCETYNYFLTNEGVNFDSLKVNFCNTSLKVDEIEQGVLQLYPNPTSAKVEVRNVKDGSFSVVNVAGQSVLEGEVTMDSVVFDVADLENGVYMILIENSKGEIQSSKFIVQH